MANTLIQQIKNSFGHYKWVLHLLFWILLFGIFFLQMNQTTADHLLFIIKAVLLLSLSYIFQFAIVPLYRHPKKQYFWFAFLGVLLLIFCIRTFFIYLLGTSTTEPVPAIHQLINLVYHGFANYFFPFTFFVALFYFLDIHDQQKEIQRLIQIKTQKIALESSFLKSQVNPHFLFNTLNNIYALSLRRSEQTAIIIEKLESLLHYMLYDCKAELVPLENEFNFTDSYIALEKLRHKEDQCSVTVTKQGDPKGKMIAPLLLINFLENAFKHGTKTSFGKSWINLNIDIQEQGIHFKLQNSKPLSAIGQAITEYQGGIGLKNVERRLQILYPERHTLEMKSLKDRFEIDLIINFQT